MDGNRKKKLGVALLGLGTYSTDQLGPALRQTKNCYLAGIISDDRSKEKKWIEDYNISRANVYTMEDFDNIAFNADIDIVYVVLPVFMHKEYTIRAARAGKHVICEKPMAMDVAECLEMIAACESAGKKLSIGYHLHFEPYNLEMMRLGQDKIFGKVLSIESGNGFVISDHPSSWRLKKNLAGGGSLMDMGIYTIQGARYITGEEPMFTTAREEKTRPDMFKEVDETVYFTLEFPTGAIANCVSSFSRNLNYLKAVAEEGWFELTSAFRYDGMSGATSDGPMRFDSDLNQQSVQIDDFAECIIENKISRVSGEEGLKDMKVIEAIYKSIKSGQREAIK